MNTVSVIKIKSDLDNEIVKLMDLSGAKDLIKSGDIVLLKPNLHAVQHYTTGGTTNPYVVAAVIKWAYKCGAKEVIVGDSPYYGLSDPRRCFTETGMGEIVEKSGARWVTFGEHEFRIFRSASRHLPEEVGISRFVFDCDKMINISAMKTHFNCLVTLCMKNLKGCVRPEDKAAFHKADVNRAIVAINSLIKPHLNIIDGTVGMEGMGPASGTPVNCNLLLAGKDIVGVDSAASFLMGIQPEEVMTIKRGYQAGLGDMNLDNIQITGDKLDDLKMNWKRPDSTITEKFPNLIIRNKGACSGCNMNLLVALNDVKSESEISYNAVVMGQDEPVEKNSVLIGKCTSSFWKDYDHISGCPPKSGDIKKLICLIK
ncbi:DUF362 domain-containing protein [Candidatus Poribacteria bacterium]|nr:DUF362 domain-containing protein [Candidatus Poribacteria bacterium]